MQVADLEKVGSVVYRYEILKVKIESFLARSPKFSFGSPARDLTPSGAT